MLAETLKTLKKEYRIKKCSFVTKIENFSEILVTTT